MRPTLRIAATAAALLLATSCSSSTPEPSEQPTSSPATSDSSASNAPTASGFEPKPIEWQACTKKDFKGQQCATLTVPMDYDNPAGPTTDLALVMKPHAGKTSKGVLLTNPGGPGSSGLFMAGSTAAFDNAMRAYDIVGMDPRGVGASKPAMTCGSSMDRGDQELEPADQAAVDALQTTAEAYATECEKTDSAELLPHLTTANVAEDLDSIRKAMGVEKVSYWGNSYGSHLGQVYATVHPDRVERMLLDGVVDPDVDWSTMGWNQAQSLEANLPRFYTYLAKNPKAYNLGTDPKQIGQRVTKLHTTLAASAKTKKSADALVGVLKTAVYGVSGWPMVGQSLDLALNKKDYRGLRAERMGANPRAAYLGIMCNESVWPEFAGFLADAKAAAQKAPIFTWGEARLSSPCPSWPGDPVEPVTIDPTGLTAPVLLYGETYDGATPFSGALAARELFSTSALVEGKGGTTHRASVGATGCSKQAIVKFWTDGTLPQRKPGNTSDLQCPPAEPAGVGVS